VQDPQLIAVLGHYRNSTVQAARSIYDQAGVSFLDAGTVEGDIRTQTELLCFLLDHIKSARQTDAISGHSSFRVQWVTDDKAAEPHDLDCTDGLSVTVNSRLLLSSWPDVVLLTRDPVASAETLAALRQFGWDGLVVGGPTLGSPLFSQIADPTGVEFVSPYRIPDPDDTDAEFVASYQSLGPHVPGPGLIALTTYRTANALFSAVEASIHDGEHPTRQSLSWSQHLQPTSEVYIYRWKSPGKLQLAKVGTIMAKK
jgi:hypothetical protein